jgi:hypothetical protein
MGLQQGGILFWIDVRLPGHRLGSGEEASTLPIAVQALNLSKRTAG